jgi:hypothetical protein
VRCPKSSTADTGLHSGGRRVTGTPNGNGVSETRYQPIVIPFQVQRPWHAGFIGRRTKTIAELVDGVELFALEARRRRVPPSQGIAAELTASEFEAARRRR